MTRQRRDYGIDVRFPPVFSVKQQAANIEDAPTLYLAVERDRGWIDYNYRLRKSAKLSVMSRQHILQWSKDSREGTTSNFRSYRQAAKNKRELKLLRSKQMEQKMRKSSDHKMKIALMQHRKKFRPLGELEGVGRLLRSRRRAF